MNHGLSVVLLLGGCGSPSLRTAEKLRLDKPARLDRPGIERAISELPSYAPFSMAGVAFHHGDLFVGSNIGLLRFRGQSVEALRWASTDSVVTRPWHDAAHDALWIHDEGRGCLRRLDSEGWHRIAYPEKRSDHLTRGDVMHGYELSGDTKNVWICGAGEVSRWDSERRTWIAEEGPWDERAGPKKGGIASFASWNEGQVCVLRNQLLGYWVDTLGTPDTIYVRGSGSWSTLPQPKSPLFADSMAPATASAFVREWSDQGWEKDLAPEERDEHHLFEVNTRGISRLAWIGNCEALVSSSHARPLASIVGKGIYVLEGSGWKKLFACPLTKTEGDHSAYLAESDGSVAYLTRKAPKIVPTDLGSNHAEWTETGTDGLWISENGRLIPLYLEGRWLPSTSSGGN